MILRLFRTDKSQFGDHTLMTQKKAFSETRKENFLPPITTDKRRKRLNSEKVSQTYRRPSDLIGGSMSFCFYAL
jgi:hypothetical protein